MRSTVAVSGAGMLHRPLSVIIVLAAGMFLVMLPSIPAVLLMSNFPFKPDLNAQPWSNGDL